MAPWSIFVRGSRWNRAFFGDVGFRLFGFATWIPVLIWFQDNVGNLTTIHGPSMYPYFNDHINSSLTPSFVWNYCYQPQNNLQRGMIVSLRSSFNPEVTSIKRIIALEGDEVTTKPPAVAKTVRVPPGHIWVEGDGTHTLDSNTYGPVSAMLVTGKITFIFWPLHRFGPVNWREDAKAKMRTRTRT